MPAINLLHVEGQAVDQEKQKALLVLWLLLNTNSLLTNPTTRAVSTDTELAEARTAGAGQHVVNFVDLREVADLLKPLELQHVKDVWEFARNADEVAASANDYVQQGIPILGYGAHVCLGMCTVLKFNK